MSGMVATKTGVKEEVIQRLALLKDVSQNIPKGLQELIALADKSMSEILKAAIDDGKWNELFPSEDLKEIMDGLPRLRCDENGHWVQVFSGSENLALDEVCNHLRLVRIPLAGLRVLQAMGNVCLREIGAMSEERKAKFYELDDVAGNALEYAVEEMSIDQLSLLSKQEKMEIQRYLKGDCLKGD